MHSDRYVFIAGVLYYIQFISTDVIEACLYAFIIARVKIKMN